MPDPTFDAAMMRRAIALAMRGRGGVEPNPMVGCVIAQGDRVIGEGYHQRYGGPHAEPTALAACTESPTGATAYVTLEPCCHTNKQTPPCAPRLIAAKVARVVVGCRDPNPAVDGKGLAMLREAGVAVDGPVLESEAKQLIAPFVARTKHGRPYVTLKWAESADGKVAGPGGRRVQISNARSTRVVHELRARCDAIMVGINTVLTDDPTLTARGVANARPLLRIVLDRSLRIPLSSNLVRTARGGGVRIYHDGRSRTHDTVASRVLGDLGVDVYTLAADPDGQLPLSRVVGALDRAATHLLVEPGPTLAASFFRDDLADRFWVFRSPNRIEGETAPAAAPVPTHFVPTGTIDLGGDRLTEFLNPHGPVYFGPHASADFVLAGAGGASPPHGDAPPGSDTTDRSE